MTVAQKKTMLLEKAAEGYGFEDLITVVEVLRSEEGCPWDREQDHKSIRRDFIEETYEVIEAIDTDDPKLLREELGDVLLQVTFHAQIEAEKGVFDIEDVANDICVKLIHRHPHVFGDVKADTSEKVLSNWEIIKSEEKERKTVTDKLRAIPPMLPALMRAEKVGKKATMDGGERDEIFEEMGDLLLSVTSLCRKLGVESEVALGAATNKFIDRFDAVEQEVISQGKQMSELTLGELDAIWDKNKQK